MLQLRVLGPIDLRLLDRPAAVKLGAQAKRLALLVYLALARGAVRRDTLIALLWPDLTGDRARHALRQTVYSLRRSVGSEVLVSRSEEELEVSPDALRCDVLEFEALLTAGRREEALDLYRGEFLEGLHPPDVGEEFEDWLAATRQRLRGLAGEAAAALLAQAQSDSNQAQALRWARRGTQLDPLDEHFQLELVNLLGTTGDRIAARRAAESYAARLERDLGVTPSAPLREALARLERADVVAAVVEPVAPAAEPAGVLPPAAAPVSAAVVARHPRRWPLVALVVLVLGAAATRVVISRSNAPPERPILAVAAIRQAGLATDSGAVWPVADLLATSLARLPATQVVPNARLIETEQALAREGRSHSMSEVARQVGAAQLLEGTLMRLAEDSLVLELRRSDLRTGGILQSYRVGGRDIFDLVDRATAAIARGAGVAAPTQGIADVTTTSAVALRFYQQGLRSFYSNDIAAARRLFEAAVEEDSTFAMATWYLGRVEGLLQLPTGRDRLHAALELAADASDRERLLITAYVLVAGSAAAAPAVAETLATRYPADRDALWVLGMARALTDLPGGIEALRRALLLDSTPPAAAGPQCTICDIYGGLVGMYQYSDSLERALVVAKEFAARVPDSESAWSRVQYLAMMLGDSAALVKANRELYRTRSGPRPVEVGIDVLADLYGGHYRSADSALQTLGRLDPAVRSSVRWYQVISLRDQHRLDEALVLAQSPPVDRLLVAVVDFERGRFARCAAFYGDLARSPDFQKLSERWPGAAAREVSWALARTAMCRAAGGDTTGFIALADSVQRIGALSGYDRDQRIHHYVRGLLWQARADPARAVEEFRLAMSSPNLGFTRINYHLAESLLQLNRPAEAIATLRSALRGALDASNLYLTRTAIHDLLGSAWEQAGNPDSARAHRERSRLGTQGQR